MTSSTSTSGVHRGARAPAGRRSSRRAARRRRASRSGSAASSTMGGFGAFTDTFEDLARPGAAPGLGPQRLMADGLRLRRGGRLEGRRAGPRDEGRWPPACPAARRSWRTTPTTSATRVPEVLGAHMLEVCPSIATDRPSCEIHPLVDRRQGRPGAAGVRRCARACARGRPRRPRRPVPLARQPGRHRGARLSRCRSCRWPVRSGGRGPTCRPPRRRG